MWLSVGSVVVVRVCGSGGDYVFEHAYDTAWEGACLTLLFAWTCKKISGQVGSHCPVTCTRSVLSVDSV